MTGDGASGYLCTNNGIRALFHVIKDVADHIGQKEGTELCLADSDNTFNKLEPYLGALVEFFKTTSSQNIHAFRRIGSSLTAVRQQAYGMEALVQKQFPDFKPAGLQEYLESRDEAGTADARAKVLHIQKRIFDYVIGTLKREYGTEEKRWWVKGVPSRIRVDCSSRWEEGNRKGDEEAHLFLINYVEICIQNWGLVKDTISLGARDKEAKRENTKWIKMLNPIRNKVTHPEQGLLGKDEVAFVEDIYDQVEHHFPHIDLQPKPIT